MFEKYDATCVKRIGGGGEYEIQVGFGWTNATVLDFLNMYLAAIAAVEGRSQEALQLLSNVSEVDAGAVDQAIFLVQVGLIRNVAGDPEAAVAASARSLRLVTGGRDRAFVLWRHALNLVDAGRAAEARAVIEEGWQLDRSAKRERYAYLYAAIGETERAREILTNPRFELTQHFPLALAYLELGDHEQALQEIADGIANRDQNLLLGLRLGRWWDPLRSDPRFQTLLEEMDAQMIHTPQFSGHSAGHGTL